MAGANVSAGVGIMANVDYYAFVQLMQQHGLLGSATGQGGEIEDSGGEYDDYHSKVDTHWTLTIHSLDTHYTLTGHSLYTHYTLTIHSLYTPSPPHPHSSHLSLLSQGGFRRRAGG
jgi:hypothetical protein